MLITSITVIIPLSKPGVLILDMEGVQVISAEAMVPGQVVQVLIRQYQRCLRWIMAGDQWVVEKVVDMAEAMAEAEGVAMEDFHHTNLELL